jgi:prolipoprotein diacylglyceryltransferase
MIDVSLTATVMCYKSHEESAIKCAGKFTFCYSFRLIIEAVRSKASTVSGSLNTLDPLFDPTRGMDSALCLSMFVLSCVCRGLATICSVSKDSYTLSIQLIISEVNYELKQDKGH